MPYNEITAIKEAEATAVARIQAAREKSEERIRKAESDAALMVEQRVEEGQREVMRLHLEAEGSALAQAGRIREEARITAAAIKQVRDQNMAEAVQYIIDAITGEIDVSPAGDEKSAHRDS
ncbi:MAG: hypothetical protein GKC04_01370 [Methanomicrobiales archaeon]|nr:hypothetical protein [Methanomicrobiales archaeon]